MNATSDMKSRTTCQRLEASCRRPSIRVAVCGITLALLLPPTSGQAGEPVNVDQAVRVIRSYRFESLRLAITDLIATYGKDYAGGPAYLERLARLEASARTLFADLKPDDRIQKTAPLDLARELEAVRQEALLANPLLRFDKLLLLRQDAGRFRLPRNDACYSSIPHTGYNC